ncbi:MAG: hypothetical protein Q9168_000542 [Polycauliona sp. 1 TL-2023]
MPIWSQAQEKRVYGHEQDDALRKDLEMGDSSNHHGEKEYEQRVPMLATTNEKRADPFAGGRVEMDGSHAGDLGQANGNGYRPYGQAYTAYSSPVGAGGNSWRNVYLLSLPLRPIVITATPGSNALAGEVIRKMGKN